MWSFWDFLFCILHASYIWMSVSFPRLGKVLPNMVSICSQPPSLFFLFVGLLQYFSMVKKLPANAGDARDSRLIPGSGRSPGEENGSPLQYSCLENSMDRRAWQAVVHGATDSQAQLGVPTRTHVDIGIGMWVWAHTCVYMQVVYIQTYVISFHFVSLENQ